MRVSRHILMAVGFCLGLLVPDFTSVARAQPLGTPRTLNLSLSLPVAPELTTALQVAEQAIAAQDWSRAAEVLQLILNAEEDAFLSPGDPHSVQSRAASLIAALPPAGRQQYERLFTPAAEALLAEAQSGGSLAPWGTLVRRYFHTPPGLRAAWRLALLRQDQGVPLGAARLFDQLLADPAAARLFGDELRLRAASAWLAAGVPARAEALLQEMARSGVTKVTVQGKEIAVEPPGAPSLEWLARLSGLEAGTNTPPVSTQLPPFLPPSGPPEWSVPVLCTDELLVLYPDRARQLNETLRRLEVEQRAEADKTGRLLFPASRPVVEQGRVILRAPDRMTAWSLGHGALGWIGTPVDFTYRELAETSEFASRDDPARTLYFGQRAWRDQTSSALVSDGTNVYTIMDSGMLGAVDAGTAAAANRHPKGAFRDNALQAYALRGGKQRWSIGGPAGPGDDPFAGLFFLGPPLPHEGRLYALVEDQGQVRLLVLDPSTPDRPTLLWSQALLNPSPMLAVEFDQTRRLSGLTPIALGQLLICPTGAGSVVAMDVLQQRLAWVATYDHSTAEPAMPIRGGARMRMPGDSLTRQRIALDKLLDAEVWRQQVPVVAGGRLLVAVRDADALLCLNAADGEILWTRPRDSALYIADVTADHAVLVGRSAVEAVRLDDGRPAWPQSTPIPAPSGFGFTHHGRYTFPLSTGEIATIDLATGRMLARSPIHGSVPPGNLHLAEGRLLSLSAAQLRAWPALASVPALLAEGAAAPESPEQLALRGELRLHGGDHAGGVADLRAALDQRDDPRLRRVLAGTLLEGLRSDFAAHRADAPEIEHMVTGLPEEAAFRRLYATQLQAHGDTVAAFVQWLRLAELASAGQALEAVDEKWSVSPDRWIEAQVKDLLKQATPADRDRMLAGLGERLAAALQQPDESAIRRSLQSLVRMARGTPLELSVVLELARRAESDAPLHRAWLWQTLQQHADKTVVAEATAQLAGIYLRANETLAAAPLVARLRGDLAQTVCLDGKTGSEWIAVWEQDDRLRGRLAHAVVEPVSRGPWEVTLSEAESDLSQFRVLPVIGPAEGPLAGWTFVYDDSQLRLAAYTPMGRFGWESAVGSDAGGERTIPQAVMVRGGLVMVLWESRFQFIAAVVKDGGPYRSVIGGRTLVADNVDEATFVMQGRRDRMGRRIGVAGPLTSQLVCYQSGSHLIGIDPWTGSEVWRRQHVAGVSEILADDEYVVVRPYGQAELLVLRAADGELLAQRPPPTETLSPPPGVSWGRKLVMLASQDGQIDRLQMYDPVTGQPTWERPIISPVFWSADAGGNLLIVDGRHGCVMLDAADGRELFRVTLPVGADPQPWDSLTAWTDRERVYVVLNQRQDASVLRFDRQLTSERAVNGWLCAIDRAQGEILWSSNIPGMYVDLTHPPDWPVLVLSARQKAAVETENRFSYVVIDKHTGEVVSESRTPAKTALRPDTRASWRVSGTPPLIRLGRMTGVLEIREAPSVSPDP